MLGDISAWENEIANLLNEGAGIFYEIYTGMYNGIWSTAVLRNLPWLPVPASPSFPPPASSQ